MLNRIAGIERICRAYLLPPLLSFGGVVAVFALLTLFSPPGQDGANVPVVPAVSAAGLETVINADGSLVAGAHGSFDATGWRMETAPNGAPRFVRDTSGVQPAPNLLPGDERWDDRFGNLLAGVSGQVRAIATLGNDVYVGGNFGIAGDQAASSIARWNGVSWSPLLSGTVEGVNAPVNALAVRGSDLFIGGTFNRAGGDPANNIARWDGVRFSPVMSGTTNGVNSRVLSLLVDGNDLYLGGSFATAGGDPATGVVRWDGVRFSPLLSGTVQGTGPEVMALAKHGSSIAIGGTINSAGGDPASNVVLWNGTRFTTLLSGTVEGVDSSVFALASTGADLLIGGDFDNAGGDLAIGITRWNGSRFFPVPASGAGLSGGSVDAYAISTINGETFVGGHFSQAGGAQAEGLARLAGDSWIPVVSGTVPGVNGSVLALAGSPHGVVIGGSFSQLTSPVFSNIAVWTGTIYRQTGAQRLGSVSGASTSINAITVITDYVYVGGAFTHAGDVEANNIARWDGVRWSALPGAANGVNGLFSQVMSLLPVGSDLYVGGTFTEAGGVPATNVAKWNGTTWTGLYSGTVEGTTGPVRRLATRNNEIIAAGSFNFAGGHPVSNIARWNGNRWGPLSGPAGEGVAGAVLALAVNGHDLYAGGTFNLAGGITATKIARWDGFQWSPLMSGTTNGHDTGTSVWALAAYQGEIYVGVEAFSSGTPGKDYGVMQWDGTRFIPLRDPSNGLALVAQPYELAVNDQYVYAVGQIYPDTGPRDGVQRWDKTAKTWTSLGSGLRSFPFAIALTQNDVFVGGDFDLAGGKVSTRFARYSANLPSLSTSQAITVVEGNSGITPVTVPFTLSSKIGISVTVTYSTTGGTATPGTDYTPANATVVIPPNQLTGSATVQIMGDSQFEPDKTLSLEISNPVNATYGGGSPVITIVNDDPQPPPVQPTPSTLVIGPAAKSYSGW